MTEKPSNAELIELLRTADVRAAERASAIHTRIDHLARAMLRLAEHFHERTESMSATTDAIKADLVKLEATVDDAVARSGAIAEAAVAAEEAELTEIRAHLESIGTKVDALVPAAPTAVVSTATTA